MNGRGNRVKLCAFFMTKLVTWRPGIESQNVPNNTKHYLAGGTEAVYLS